MSGVRAGAIVAAVLAALLRPAIAADAMESFDEYELRGFTILKCHPAQNDADRAHLSKTEAMRKSAFEALWARLDRVNPGHHDENGKLADQTLERRTAAHDRFIQSQVNEYGCDWLDGKAFAPSP